jgi:hypothetical protein
MPDLDQIKTGETGIAGSTRAVFQGPVGQSRRPGHAAAATTSTALPGCCSPARAKR